MRPRSERRAPRPRTAQYLRKRSGRAAAAPATRRHLSSPATAAIALTCSCPAPPPSSRQKLRAAPAAGTSVPHTNVPPARPHSAQRQEAARPRLPSAGSPTQTRYRPSAPLPASSRWHRALRSPREGPGGVRAPMLIYTVNYGDIY